MTHRSVIVKNSPLCPNWLNIFWVILGRILPNISLFFQLKMTDINFQYTSKKHFDVLGCKLPPFSPSLIFRSY